MSKKDRFVRHGHRAQEELSGQFSFSMSGIVWAGLLFQNLLVCVFGIVFGVLLLDEPVESQFIFGAALVLAGIALVSGWQWFMQHIFHVQSHIKKETSS